MATTLLSREFSSETLAAGLLTVKQEEGPEQTMDTDAAKEELALLED